MADADFDLLRSAVREAGALAAGFLKTKFKRWKKPDNSVVTEADHAVDALLKERLGAARPEYGWLSEETPDAAARLSRRELWIADPIDGTRSFADGSDEWCVAAALIRDGAPVLSAVYRPLREDFYEAAAGQGAYLNGARLDLKDTSAGRSARIIGHAGTLKALAAAMPLTQVPGGNTPLSMRLAFVASGDIDAALSPLPKHDWDLAAGALLVTEANGSITTATGEAFRFNQRRAQQAGYVAADAALHRKILEVMSPL
ncbi:3'(2'),5'-bisphosphate nucleotidase CysQ [soil metagenome]